MSPVIVRLILMGIKHAMLEPKLYSIEVTEDIAAKIRYLAEIGFFAMKRGKCIVNFTNEGTISSVENHIFHYPQQGLLIAKDESIMKP